MIHRTLARFRRVVRCISSAFARPLFRQLYLSRRHYAQIGDVRLTVPAGVFPPGPFVSSKMLGLYVRSLPLRGKRVLDLGTGSGVVGIHAERAGASVLAVDVNPLAVTAAKSNAHQNGCSAFEGRESDLFEEIGGDERFDLIAWNPPFYATDPTGTEDPAWFAGPGYERLRLLSAGADRHLLSGGSVLLVLSSDLDLPLLWGIFAGDAWRLSVVEIRPGFFADHLLLALRK